MEECFCSHKHDFGISTEWIGAPSDGIGAAVETTYIQAKPPKVFE